MNKIAVIIGLFLGLWLALLPPGWAAEQPTPEEVIFRDLAVAADPSGRVQLLHDTFARHVALPPVGWAEEVNTLRDLPPLQQLGMAQTMFNHKIRYADDIDNEWKTPKESYASGGDCEDYVIAKMLLLRDAGFPEADLRMVTLAPATNYSPYHVVLVARVAGQYQVLDSPRRNGDHSDEIIALNEYRDRNRAVAWSGWTGGFTSANRNMEGGVAVWASAAPRYRVAWLNRLSHYLNRYGSADGLIAITHDLQVIRTGQSPVWESDSNRIKYQKQYYSNPTLDEDRRIIRGENRGIPSLWK